MINIIHNEQYRLIFAYLQPAVYCIPDCMTDRMTLSVMHHLHLRLSCLLITTITSVTYCFTYRLVYFVSCMATIHRDSTIYFPHTCNHHTLIFAQNKLAYLFSYFLYTYLKVHPLLILTTFNEVNLVFFIYPSNPQTASPNYTSVHENGSSYYSFPGAVTAAVGS